MLLMIKTNEEAFDHWGKVMLSKQLVLLSSTEKTGLSGRMKHTGGLFPPLFSRYTSCSPFESLKVLSDSAPFGLRHALMWRCLPRDSFGTGSQCLMAPLVSSSLTALINPIKSSNRYNYRPVGPEDGTSHSVYKHFHSTDVREWSIMTSQTIFGPVQTRFIP